MTHPLAGLTPPTKLGPLAREAAAKARKSVFAVDPEIRAARAAHYAEQDRARAEAAEAEARDRHAPLYAFADRVAERVDELLPALASALDGPDAPVLRARLAELASRPAQV